MMLCETVQELKPRGAQTWCWEPQTHPTGPQVRAGLTKHLQESCSQAHARHLLSPRRNEGLCSPSTCQRPAPVVWVRSQCWAGSKGTEGGPGSLQAAFQDPGDVLFSRRSGKRRFYWERVQDPELSLKQQDLGNRSPREGRWEGGLWGVLAES